MTRHLPITPRTQLAHKRLYQVVDQLTEALLELAPRSAALADVADRLESLADEYREWAMTCAESEAYEVDTLKRWANSTEAPCR